MGGMVGLRIAVKDFRKLCQILRDPNEPQGLLQPLNFKGLLIDDLLSEMPVSPSTIFHRNQGGIKRCIRCPIDPITLKGGLHSSVGGVTMGWNMAW